jgi:DNA repair exonuclease SbcCD ATPase subunit
MRSSLIKARNLFGLRELNLDGSSVEITGKNGTGKTSGIDAIRLALTNDSSRDYVIFDGEKEGEIFIETDTGLTIDRKKRVGKADYKSVKENGREVHGPENFLKTIFTPLQLNPVEFTQMSKQEQNRVILDLIEFDWDISWIKEQFGEIPQGINYEQNILQVLNDIQSENGDYFQERQNINRDRRNKEAFVEDIAKDIPAGYQADKWEVYSIADKSRELSYMQDINGKIERAKSFKASYDNKIRSFEADREIAISAEEKAIAGEREGLKSTIERLKAEIRAAEDTIGTLDSKLDDKRKIVQAEYETKVAKLEKDMEIADEYIGKEVSDTSPLKDEIDTAETMKKHLNEYKRMILMQDEIEELKKDADELTRKIELARNLPGQILKDANMPIEGLTVKDGTPLVNGLPVSNLSDGEKLDLCVDVAASKADNLQIILIDGTEKLSTENRKKMYKKCKDKGLQVIATRTTDADTLEVTVL